MADSDDFIKWCRERRAFAIEDIADYNEGRRQFLSDEDITDKLRVRAQNDIKQFDKLIARLEADKAKGL